MATARRQGQLIGGEYAVLLMVAIVAVSTMMLFVRRAIDGRANDAQVRMIRMAELGSGNTLTINMEYEPYYTKSIARSATSGHEQTKVTEGAAHRKTSHAERAAIMNAYQLPPAAASGKVEGLEDGSEIQ